MTLKNNINKLWGVSIFYQPKLESNDKKKSFVPKLLTTIEVFTICYDN